MTRQGQQGDILGVSATPTRRKGRKASVLLLAGSIAAAFGIGELAVRLVLKDRVVLFPRFHSTAVYGNYTLRRLRPRTEFWHTSADGRWQFVTNAQGFRDTRDFPYAKPPGRLRVLALGDSHTQGFEVRQDFTYAAVTERWLRSRGLDAEVINAGVSGFSTAESLVFLENEGVRYLPDVVVLGLSGNDYVDNLRSGLFTVLNDTLMATGKTYAPAAAILDLLNGIPPLRWLSEHSYLYSVAFNTVWERYKALSVREAHRGLATEYVTPTSVPGGHESSLMAALLRRLGSFCRARGMLLVIVDIPVWQGRGVGGFTTSILPSIQTVLLGSADVVILSEDALGPYKGVAELHVPHGQHHISEFSHTVFGVRVGQAILAARRDCGASEARLEPCAIDDAHRSHSR